MLNSDFIAIILNKNENIEIPLKKVKEINSHEKGFDIRLSENIQVLNESMVTMRFFGLVKGENNKFRIISDNTWAEDWIQTINLALQQNNVQISSLNNKTETEVKPNHFNNSDQNKEIKKPNSNSSSGCYGCSSILGNNQNTSDKPQSQYIIEKPVRFLGGDKMIPDPTDGNLMLSKESIIFKDNQSGKIEIQLEKINRIEIVDDKYTPSLKRGLIMGVLGGDTESQSFRPHKSVLKISYQTEKRIKDLEFNFMAITWAGSVEDCQQFYSKLNALLD